MLPYRGDWAQHDQVLLYRNIPRYGDDDHVGITNLSKANFIFKKIL